METWALVLVVYQLVGRDEEPRGMTSVPGYTSYRECQEAGRAAFMLSIDKVRYRFECIPGPRK